MPRSSLSTQITVTDQFCGAGGTSDGAAALGLELALAMNHWKLAIETHNANFPQARHACTDIHACDPRRYPRTTILVTSPECTNHTIAKGVKRASGQLEMNLFDEAPLDDDAAVRSRATMWDVVRFTEVHRYEIIVVENVVDARYWELYDEWLNAMLKLGYDHQAVYFNSMFAWPTPQSRDRMYVVFWRKGNRKPDLNFTPTAWCIGCSRNVPAKQAWKNPERPFGKYRQQYLYCCPFCAKPVQPYYYAAANCIDWTIPAPKIGERRRPLKDKTRARIAAGLKKYGRQPLQMGLTTMPPNFIRPASEALGTQTGTRQYGLVSPPFIIHTNRDERHRPAAVTEPMNTQTGSLHPAVVVPPFIVNTAHGTEDPQKAGTYDRAYATEPMPSQTGRHTTGVVVPPLIIEAHGTSTARPATDALSTVTGEGNHHFLLDQTGEYRPRSLAGPTPTIPGEGTHLGLVSTPFILDQIAEGRNRAITDPLSTATGAGVRQTLITPPLAPLVYSYYGNDEIGPATDPMPAQIGKEHHAVVNPPAFIIANYSPGLSFPISDPFRTITATDHHSLIDAPLPEVDECGFRMLTTDEIRAAMAFRPDYILYGTQREKVKMLGNAVTPPVASMILERCIATLL